MPYPLRIAASILCLVAIFSALIPWYADRLMNDSLEQAEMGWQVDALHTAEKAMGFNPLSVDGMFVLAGVQQRLGRVAEARATLVRATEMQPQNYLVWERLASYERDKWGEPGPASEHYARAVSLNPHDKQLRMRAGLPEETPD